MSFRRLTIKTYWSRLKLCSSRGPSRLHTNNTLLMRTCVSLMRNCNHALVLKWRIASLSCQRVIFNVKNKHGDSNDKIIIELGYCKISWFVRVPQIYCWPLTNQSPAIFCSTSSNQICKCLCDLQFNLSGDRPGDDDSAAAMNLKSHQSPGKYWEISHVRNHFRSMEIGTCYWLST